jgi:hypothetical protein
MVLYHWGWDSGCLADSRRAKGCTVPTLADRLIPPVVIFRESLELVARGDVSAKERSRSRKRNPVGKVRGTFRE